MQNRALGRLAILLLATFPVFSQSNPDHDRAVFHFGNKQLYVGMARRDALTALSYCCRLSPPVDPSIEQQPTAISSHFIILQGESSQPMLGAVYFSGGKVVRISHELASDVDMSEENLVTFVRAFKRALPEGSSSAVVTVRHEAASNADSDVMTIVFTNGRGVELRIGILDTPDKSNRRDFVTLEETLEPGQ